jgi:hypothetical protein
VLVADVSQDPGWLFNPLLPETKTELAVPIAIGDNVLGVLDVQDNRAGALSEEDIQLLQSLADQTAVAVQNARAYNEVQRGAEREATVSAISQQIQRATSVEEVLEVALRAGARLEGATRRGNAGVQAPHFKQSRATGDTVMIARIRSFLAPPAFEDEETTRLASLLNPVLITVFVAAIIFPTILYMTGTIGIFEISMGMIVAGMMLALRYPMHRGHIRLAGTLVALVLFLVTTALIYYDGSILNGLTAFYTGRDCASLLSVGEARWLLIRV